LHCTPFRNHGNLITVVYRSNWLLVAAVLNYVQAVTPQLSIGVEAFHIFLAKRSGLVLAARHQGSNHIATAQVATSRSALAGTTPAVQFASLQYLHKLDSQVRAVALACSQQHGEQLASDL
jgi:hypothetical protein